jgi:hypothetical protein
MKKSWSLALAVVMVLGLFAAPVSAHEGEEDLPEHGHMLLQRPEWVLVGVDEEYATIELTFRRCVDLAGGRALPLHVHHDTVHTGRAGQALWGRTQNGVIPTGISPWANCADLIANPTLQIPVDELD